MQIFLIVLGILALIAILIYNSLIGKKNQVENIFAGVDAVLKKRYDLIPNLVASVSQYMEHEKSLVYECEASEHAKLYEFLATNYDITHLASKICAMKYAKINLLSLKKLGIQGTT